MASSDSDDDDTLSLRSSCTFHPCPYTDCNRYFSRPHRLRTHILSHTGERPIKCSHEGCPKAFTRPAHLKRHLQNSHGEKAEPGGKLACPSCRKEYANKYALQKHVKIHHPSDSDKNRYVCQECGKTFHKHSFLVSHVAKDHEGVDAAFRCEICCCKFKFPGQLKRHAEHRHGSAAKKYGCPECDQEFQKWTQVRAHVAAEHRKARRTCEICKKPFSNLSQHMKHHAESREVFHCPHKVCSRFYYKLSNLNDHVKGYHEGKRFPCSFEGCDARLSTRGRLKKHLQVCHAEEKKPAKRAPSKGRHRRSMAATLSGFAAAKRDAVDGEGKALDPDEVLAETMGNPALLPSSDAETDEKEGSGGVAAFGDALGSPTFDIIPPRSINPNLERLLSLIDRQEAGGRITDKPDLESADDELLPQDDATAAKESETEVPDKRQERKFNFLKYVKTDGIT